MRTLIAIICLCSCFVFTYFTSIAQGDETTLKQACVSATVKAIDAEIGRHKAWFKQATDPKRKSELRKYLFDLTKEKKKYQNMELGAYALPKKLTISGIYKNQIYFKGRSRSGPFYHVIASATPLKKGKKYEFEIYLVYRRSYRHMPNYYVYVATVKSKKK